MGMDGCDLHSQGSNYLVCDFTKKGSALRKDLSVDIFGLGRCRKVVTWHKWPVWLGLWKIALVHLYVCPYVQEHEF